MDGMGWDGMGWDGMGWDGMGWDGMGWVGWNKGETSFTYTLYPLTSTVIDKLGLKTNSCCLGK